MGHRHTVRVRCLRASREEPSCGRSVDGQHTRLPSHDEPFDRRAAERALSLRFLGSGRDSQRMVCWARRWQLQGE